MWQTVAKCMGFVAQRAHFSKTLRDVRGFRGPSVRTPFPSRPRPEAGDKLVPFGITWALTFYRALISLECCLL